MLQARQLIPPVAIRTPAGRVARAWDFKQKKNLVIAFLRADCDRCRDFTQQLSASAAALAASEAVALVVLSEPFPLSLIPEELPENVILGTDASGHSHRAYLGEDAFGSAGQRLLGVFVADRYGELQARWLVRREDELPAIETVLSWLRQIELACEECGASDWSIEP